jgi:RND family efflux transporter MFP subunit
MSLAVGVALAACVTLAGEPKAEGPPAPDAEGKPKAHTVAPGLLKIEAELKGVFEATKMADVVFRPEAWTQLVVARAAEPGAAVKKGDAVLALDTEKIDEAIRDLEASQALADLAIQLAQAEVAALQESVPLDLQAATRAKQAADEDLQRYFEVERPLAVKQANFALTSAEHRLAYAQEELRQLEQMYKADDLTEETEEIILRRQRHAVEWAALGLEAARIKTDRELHIEFPRKDISVKDAAQRQAIALEKAKDTLEPTLRKKQLELAKQKADRQKAAEKLTNLKHDRQAMTVQAPTDGIVYYGPCVRGNWPKLAQSLERGTALQAHQVFLTIVQPRPIFVRATVPENELARVRPGITGHAAPTGYPRFRAPAKVEAVTAIPVSPGQFEARLAVELPQGAAAIVPGMTCTIKLLSYVKKGALTVPVSAVFADELDEEKTHVYLLKQDGSHEKRPVRVGQRTDKAAEILEGLKPGDTVLLHEPKNGK